MMFKIYFCSNLDLIFFIFIIISLFIRIILYSFAHVYDVCVQISQTHTAYTYTVLFIYIN